ncbi:MAG: Uncharacterized protein XD63_1562 [Thermoanaerobacterales bacterium 50_218]|nr:MAG: Uncharacterized protein XD63_1562 [Thermoanaerobacterales bacterium 50_218]HAA90501.1 DUF512 domain-containing protein [Peptococcaceae bacterium]
MREGLKMREIPRFLLYQVIRKENVLPITSFCNLRCIFCSNLQNPPGIEVFSLPPLPLSYLKRFLPLLDGSRKIIIGEAASRISEGEPFTHPEIWAILEELRRIYPETLIQITTNGCLLNSDSLKRLHAYQPLEVNLSLNSATEWGRSLLMNDREPAKIREVVGELSKFGIPFNGSIVALPHLVGWADIAESCRFLDDHGAQTIRLLFPGFTRLAPKFLRFPPRETYRRLKEFVAENSALLQAPVLLEPPFAPPVEIDLSPVVEGVLPASPAEDAGLRRREVINCVHGKRVHSRVEAFRLIQQLRKPVLDVFRDGRVIRVNLQKRKNQPSGLIMNYDLDWSMLSRVKKIITRKRARRVLLLTSQWGFPWLQKVLPELEKTGAEIQVFPVTNHFFGGSIACAGLLTVPDFRRALLQMKSIHHLGFDLILLPGIAFDHRGRDLLGYSYSVLSNFAHTEVKAVL